MANGMYTAFKQTLLGAGLNLDTADIRVILIDAADYTVNLSTDNFLDDIAGAARVATSGTLANTSITNGVFDADDFAFTSVTGDQSEALVLYNHTGTESTSNLILYIDTGTGLPVTPNGNNINVAWDNGASKIFRLN